MNHSVALDKQSELLVLDQLCHFLWGLAQDKTLSIVVNVYLQNTKYKDRPSWKNQRRFFHEIRTTDIGLLRPLLQFLNYASKYDVRFYI